MQIKLVLLVNYRENEYKLLTWRYLDHVSKQYRQWLPGYRRLLDTIRSTIRDHPRNRCTKSLYPFSLWLSSGLTIPRLRWKLAQNSSTITTKPLWLQTPYFKAFFPVLKTDIRLLLFDFFSKKAVRGSIDVQRRLNLPVPVTGAAETPAEAAVIFPSRIQSTFDFLELKSGLLDIRLLEVNFQLRVGLQKVEKGMYNPNLRSQLG